MTLVRIDVIEGRRNPVQLEILADTVHATIVEVFGAAVTERYQIITEHRPALLRSCSRHVLYRELADRLYDRLALREDDLIVTIVENTHADWSFTDDKALGCDGDL